MHEVEWRRFRAVVFESDDWGACEIAANADDATAVAEVWTELHGAARYTDATLESPADLDRLFATLEPFHGADGRPAVFTGFVCVGNPDYEKIRANGFSRYEDLGVEEGVPGRWGRGDFLAKWREGVARGLFWPELHTNLHHTSPALWLDRLNADGAKGEAARRLFDLEVYCQGEHLPEFEGLDVREQLSWISGAIHRFRHAAGYRPSCAITSDAYPETEVLWSLLGLRTVCLKNCQVNNDQIVVYPTKPWNNQDPTVKMGDWNERLDLIYLVRNAFFECSRSDEQTAAKVLPVIRRRWAANQPAVLSTHRIHYVSHNAEAVDKGYAQLRQLLGALCDESARFLTTAEVGDIYRMGWSAKPVGGGLVVRKYADWAGEIPLSRPVHRVLALPDGQEQQFTSDDEGAVLDLPLGDYWVE